MDAHTQIISELIDAVTEVFVTTILFKWHVPIVFDSSELN